MKNLEPMSIATNIDFVRPEDRAIQGWNPSAELNSNTAGWSGSSELLWPATAGSIPKRKIPGGLGDWSPKALCNQRPPDITKDIDLNPASYSLRPSLLSPIHAEPVHLDLYFKRLASKEVFFQVQHAIKIYNDSRLKRFTVIARARTSPSC